MSWGLADLSLSDSDENDEYDSSEETKPLLGLEPDFYNLAKWAFGPNGIHSLRVIAFGDFSYGERAGVLCNVILCRNDSQRRLMQQHNFHRVKMDEWEAHDYLRKYTAALEACPVNSFMED